MAIENSHTDPLSTAFYALSDPTRRSILARLAAGEASVSELMKPFALSQPTISKHLKVLQNAGLIEGGRDAQRRPRRLAPLALKEVAEWIEPRRFDQYRELGMKEGFAYVASGPLVRSSYRAGEFFLEAELKRRKTGARGGAPTQERT